MKKKEKIAAVVVTYNRKDLLQECLSSLLKQIRTLDLIIIIDNASTDGTWEVLNKKYLKNPIFDYINLGKNTGGAGGFHYGIKRAYKKGYDWVWCMDDDTIPQKNSLMEFEKAINILEKNNINIGFLASNVFWVDKEICRLNRPALNRYSEDSYKYLEEGLVEVWSSSFVSMLVSKNAIKSRGLPISDYFIWGDDAEYSLRISHEFKCYLVGKSKVIHKPKSNDTFSYKNISKEQLWKYKYSIRNMTYTVRKLEDKRIKKILFSSLLIRFIDMMKSNKYEFIPIIFFSFIKGLFFNPKVIRKL